MKVSRVLSKKQTKPGLNKLIDILGLTYNYSSAFMLHTMWECVVPIVASKAVEERDPFTANLGPLCRSK